MFKTTEIAGDNLFKQCKTIVKLTLFKATMKGVLRSFSRPMDSIV